MGVDVSTWLLSLEGGCRHLLDVLPPDRSLAAITICAVLYGALCWMISKALLAMAAIGRDLLQRAARRRATRVAG